MATMARRERYRDLSAYELAQERSSGYAPAGPRVFGPFKTIDAAVQYRVRKNLHDRDVMALMSIVIVGSYYGW